MVTILPTIMKTFSSQSGNIVCVSNILIVMCATKIVSPFNLVMFAIAIYKTLSADNRHSTNDSFHHDSVK
jgi:hypothetical protein